MRIYYPTLSYESVCIIILRWLFKFKHDRSFRSFMRIDIFAPLFFDSAAVAGMKKINRQIMDFFYT